MDFYDRGSVTLAESHWMLSLMVDLKPYAVKLADLIGEISQFKTTMKRQFAPLLVNTSSVYTAATSTYAVLLQEIRRFTDETRLVVQLYDDICLMFLHMGGKTRARGERSDLSPDSDELDDFVDELGLEFGDELDFDYDDYSTVDEDLLDAYSPPIFTATVDEELLDAYSPPTFSVPDRKRHKRGILGFMGPMVSEVFDLPSERDFTIMQANVHSLHKDTKELRAAMSNSLHIINSTVEEVQMNRNFINKLSDTVSQTTQEIYTLLSAIEYEISNNLQFTTIVDRINGYFNLAASNLRVTMHQLTILKTDLMMARYGQLSPTLISSKQILKILRKVRNSLPVDVSLPFKLRDVGLYYDLPIILTRDKGTTLCILIDIPLKSIVNEYKIYEALQVPALNQGLKTYFRLEDNFLAISEDGKFYFTLSRQELALCQISICKLNRAKYSVLFGSHCLYALYSEDPQHIFDSCTFSTKEAQTDVRVSWLKSNSWLVEGGKGLKLELVCGTENPTRNKILIKSELEELILDSGCYVESHLFKTPRYIVNSLNITVHKEISLANFSGFNFSGFYLDKSLATENPPDIIPHETLDPSFRHETLPPVSMFNLPDLPTIAPLQAFPKGMSSVYIFNFVMLGILVLFIIAVLGYCIFLRRWQRRGDIPPIGIERHNPRRVVNSIVQMTGMHEFQEDRNGNEEDPPSKDEFVHLQVN